MTSITVSASGASTFVGSQGAVKEIVLDDGTVAMMKISRYIDYSAELEYDAMRLARDLHLPHFCEPISIGIDTLTGKQIVQTKKIVGQSFTSFLKNGDSTSARAKLNVIYQVLVASAALNGKLGVCHNDLHSSNIIVAEADADVHVYVTKKTYAIKTYGYCPVIIDFGLAYIPRMKMRTVPAFTNIGYFPFAFDELTDARVITVDTVNELLLVHANDIAVLKYALTVKRLWKRLPIDKTGHFKRTVFPKICDELKRYVCGHIVANNTKKLGIFNLFDKDTFEEAMSLLLANVRMPLQRVKERTLKKLFRIVVLPVLIDSKYGTEREVARLAFEVMMFRWYQTKHAYDVSGKRTSTSDEQLVLLKSVLDSTDRDNDSSVVFRELPHLSDFRTSLKLMIAVMTNFLVPLCNRMNQYKRDLYDQYCGAVTSVGDVLNMFDMEPISYAVGMRVAVYDINTSHHYSIVLENDQDVVSCVRMFGGSNA